jgi:hypothetical protein
MTRIPKDPANIIAQILGATMDGDEERVEVLVDALHERTTYQQRVGLYRENVALYAVADEFGMATEIVESAFERLQEEAAEDDALQGLVYKVGLLETLMDEVLMDLDDLTSTAMEAVGLPSASA